MSALSLVPLFPFSATIDLIRLTPLANLHLEILRHEKRMILLNFLQIKQRVIG